MLINTSLSCYLLFILHKVAWVTKSGESDLAEPIAIRPTSETGISSHFCVFTFNAHLFGMYFVYVICVVILLFTIKVVNY